MMIALMLIGGFVGLIVGGELLVRGASNLAAAANVPPLVIGLTVVAFGTSAPELAVSIQSCYAGKTALAVGNVVGSNLSNILLILGAAAIVAPLTVSRQLFKLDVPVMIAAAAVLMALGFDGIISRGEGIAMVIALVVYLFWTIIQGKREAKALEKELEDITPQASQRTTLALISNLASLIGGLVLLIGGAGWLVDACVHLAKQFGVTEAVIGLTIVAIGTSLPELAISMIASARGKRDLAVGNVVGSNILNILCVVGMSAVVAPAGVGVAQEFLDFHIPFMIGISIACLPVFLSGFRVSRLEGLGMIGFYAAYLAWLVYLSVNRLGEPNHQTLVGFLTALGVAMLVLLVLHRKKQTAQAKSDNNSAA